MPEIERWRTTWRGLGAVALHDELYQVLVSRYSEQHRSYHTVQHLDECFASGAWWHPERAAAEPRHVRRIWNAAHKSLAKVGSC